VAQRVGRGIALLLHDRGTRRDEWSASRPGRTLPPKRTGTRFTGGLVGPMAGLHGPKISSPPGFYPRTVQPVAQSLYRLSYRAHVYDKYLFKSMRNVFPKSSTNNTYKTRNQPGTNIYNNISTKRSKTNMDNESTI